MLRQFEEDRGVAPPALQNAPFLEGELLGRYRTFLEVGKNRSYSMSGPLPITDGNLRDYFHVHRVTEDLWDDIADFVSLFDSLWIEEHYAAAEAARPKA